MIKAVCFVFSRYINELAVGKIQINHFKPLFKVA